MQTAMNANCPFPQQKLQHSKSTKSARQIPLRDATNQRAVQHPYSSKGPRKAPSPLDLYNIKYPLGAGAFGTVYLVEERVRGTLHALKTVKKSKLSCPEMHGIILEEQRTMVTFGGNKWLVGLDASFHDSQNYYMVMPFLPGGDLEGEMRRWPRGCIDPSRVKSYMAQLIVAVKSFHAAGLIHRDIKPANILFDKDGRVVLADFGLSTPYRAANGSLIHSTKTCGTPQYMAPEVYRQQPYTTNADYWALGVTFYELCFGTLPFPGRNPIEVGTKVLNAPLAFDTQCRVDPLACDLLRRMLAKDADDRILPQAIEQHPYFAGIDWQKIKSRQFTAPRIPLSAGPAPSRTPFAPFVPGTPYARQHDPTPSFHYESCGVRAALGELAEKTKYRRRVASDPSRSKSQAKRPPPRCPSQPSLRQQSETTRPHLPSQPSIRRAPSNATRSTRYPSALSNSHSISPPNTPLPTPPASILPRNVEVAIASDAAASPKSFHQLRSFFSKLVRPKHQKANAVPPVPKLLTPLAC